MKTQTLLAAILLLTLNCFAQPGIQFTSTHSWNVTLLAQTVGPDHHIYFAGMHTDSTVSELYLCKTDTFGNVVWEKLVSGLDGGPAAISVDNKSIYVSGTSYSHAFILRLDHDGNLLWHQNVWGFPGVFASGLISYGDGGCVVAGRYPSQPMMFCAYIARLDSTGSVLWSKEFHWDQFSDGMFSSVAVGDAGNIYACGGAGPSTPANVGTIVKFDPDGNTLWSRYYYTSYSFSFSQCAFDGQYLFATGPINRWSTGATYIMSIDTSGNPVTQVLIGDSLTPYSTASLGVTAYHTLLLTGAINFNDGVLFELGQNLNFLRGLQNPAFNYICGADIDGTRFHISGYMNYPAPAQYIRGVADLNWNFGCGFSSLNMNLTNLTCSFNTLTDSVTTVVINTGTSQVSNTNIPFTSCINPTGIVNPPTPITGLYPNPTQNRITIQFRETLPNATELFVYNVNGAVVHSELAPSGSTQIELLTESWPSGIYFIRTEAVKIGEFIVQH